MSHFTITGNRNPYGFTSGLQQEHTGRKRDRAEAELSAEITSEIGGRALADTPNPPVYAPTGNLESQGWSYPFLQELELPSPYQGARHGPLAFESRRGNTNFQACEKEDGSAEKDLPQILISVPPTKLTLASAEPVEYSGQIKQSLPHGLGDAIFEDGSHYRGEWVDGLREGSGEMRYKDGSVYSGLWRNDLPHGSGKKTYSNGSFYQGELVNGMAEGQGKALLEGGAVYEGFWKNDVFHGKGTMYFDENKHYAGDWKEGQKHGRGKAMYCKGEWYEGAWENDKPHGKGQMRAENGDLYIGQWQEGKRHGRGVMCYGQGGIFEGLWENGEPGEGKYIPVRDEKWEAEDKDTSPSPDDSEEKPNYIVID